MSQFLSLYHSAKDFKVLDFKTFSQENGILTWYIDFEENDPKWKSKIAFKKDSTPKRQADYYWHQNK